MATVVFTCLLSSASVTGTLSLDGMTGPQWANVKDHSLLVIDVHYVWSNEVVVSEDGTTPPDDTGETGDGTTEDGDEAAEAVEGWVASSTLMTLTADSEQHIGYDLAGSITRDTLSGQAGEKSTLDSVGSTSISIASGEVETPAFSYLTTSSYNTFFESFHNLSGDYTNWTSEPRVRRCASTLSYVVKRLRRECIRDRGAVKQHSPGSR